MTLISESVHGTGPFDVRKIRSRRQADLVAFEQAAVPITLVSADSHAVAPPEDFLAYLEPEYHYIRDVYLADMEKFYDFFGAFGYPFTPEELDVIDARGALRSGGEIGTFDPARRLREVEAEGIVAELINPGSVLAFPPLFGPLQTKHTPELRAAGARAHNRFLRDFCSEAPDRLVGVYVVHPWPDIDAIAEQCERVREWGGRAIQPVSQAGVPGDCYPAFFDPYWDPMWRACQDNELVVHIHAGWGRDQANSLQDTLDMGFARVAQKAREGEKTTAAAEVFGTFGERRPLWQLMWGGVFDRFPRLKVSFVEIHGDWVPGTLAYLDQRYRDEGGTAMKLTPSEYWQRHCAVGASLMRYGDLAARHQIGVEKLMFGSDYPHREGSWPNTLDWLRATMDDIPEPEARKILGENAIEFYGLDRALLTKEALRCGPLPSEILGRSRSVDPRILQNFEDRGGIGKAAEVYESDLSASLDETIGALADLTSG